MDIANRETRQIKQPTKAPALGRDYGRPGMFRDEVDQSVRADKADRVDSRSEPMKSLEGLQNDADRKIEGQITSGASMQRATAIVQEMLQAFVDDERLTAARTTEQAASQCCWMLHLSSGSGFEGREIIHRLKLERRVVV